MSSWNEEWIFFVEYFFWIHMPRTSTLRINVLVYALVCQKAGAMDIPSLIFQLKKQFWNLPCSRRVLRLVKIRWELKFLQHNFSGRLAQDRMFVFKEEVLGYRLRLVSSTFWIVQILVQSHFELVSLLLVLEATEQAQYGHGQSE